MWCIKVPSSVRQGAQRTTSWKSLYSILIKDPRSPSIYFYSFQTQSGDEAFCTTSTDLAGFWDMVMIQVEDVNQMFVEIEKLKQNGWKSPVVVRAKHRVSWILNSLIPDLKPMIHDNSSCDVILCTHNTITNLLLYGQGLDQNIKLDHDWLWWKNVASKRAQVHIQIPPDQLHGSHKIQYRCGYSNCSQCTVEGTMRVLLRYCMWGNPVTVASEYPHSTLSGTLVEDTAVGLLHNMRPT